MSRYYAWGLRIIQGQREKFEIILSKLKLPRRTGRLCKQDLPLWSPDKEGAAPENGCYFSIFTPHNFVLRESDRLLNCCIALSLLEETSLRLCLPDWVAPWGISRIWPIHFPCCFLTFELRRSARAIQSSWHSPTEKFLPFSVTSACNFSGSFIIYKTQKMTHLCWWSIKLSCTVLLIAPSSCIHPLALFYNGKESTKQQSFQNRR